MFFQVSNSRWINTNSIEEVSFLGCRSARLFTLGSSEPIQVEGDLAEQLFDQLMAPAVRRDV